MSESVPLCTHTKTDGVRCGSPAVSGTALCYHHSAMKATLDKVPAQRGAGVGGFEPIPFVFPEDRAAVQLNYFLLLRAFNEGRVDDYRFKAMMGLLRAMAVNLGRMGSLLSKDKAQESSASAAQKRDAGHPQQAIGNRDQRSAVGRQETVGDVALSAAAERAGGGEFLPAGPDYGFLPSVASSPKAGADSFRMMARQAARMRW